MDQIPRLARVTGRSDVPTDRKVPQLIRVPAIDPIVGIVVSDSIFALPTHFSEGRTRLCVGESACSMCGVAPTKWYGLIAVWSKMERRPMWVQLTSQAADRLLAEIEQRQMVLHGLSVRICRERKVKNAPIVITIDPYAHVPDGLPKPLDPQETIERVFGSRDSSRSNGRKAV
jgi:hypothetical protein